MRVRVVGAGVVGLCCAIRLREAGADAHVTAAATGSATTSAVAAALWYPFRVGPADLVRRWGAVTFEELSRLAADPATGVAMREGVHWLRTEQPRPDWATDVPGFHEEPVAAAGSPYRTRRTFAAPVADSSVYLSWLADRLAALGGTVLVGELAGVEQACDGVDVAVLATGIGARALPGDDTVWPVHGQVVRVAAPWITRWVLDDEHPDGLVYVVPRGADVVCGGIDADGFGPGSPDPAVREAILRRCTEVVPELAGATVLGEAVGVRPTRPAVRVEREGGVVHCYGHGGAGFTLSWGCADAARDLVLGG